MKFARLKLLFLYKTNRNKLRSSYLLLGVFLFVRMGTIYSTNELVCYNLRKNVNQEFLYQILSSQRFENSMIACGQGAAQMNIGKGDVENYVLPYSSNGNNILFCCKNTTFIR